MLRQIFILLIVLLATTPAFSATRLRGRVIDSKHQPVPGATVIILGNGKMVSGIATDSDGKFDLRINRQNFDSLFLRVSSVGYHEQRLALTPEDTDDVLQIELESMIPVVTGIKVHPKNEVEPSERVITSDDVIRQANRSMVPTNPTAALKQPQISRGGSNHSSQVRVHGTNPVYFLNGLPIGTDPAHYGLFSFIPAPVIKQVRFFPSGTSADQRLPSVIEFHTLTGFTKHSNADGFLSTIDATGSFSVGSERFFVLGSLRKSVLDHLVKTLNVSSDRQTLPPTNFQDVFASAGVRLSPNLRLMLDQYDVRDFLSYNTASATGNTSGFNTHQKSWQQYMAARLEYLNGRLLTRARFALRNEERVYRAEPDEGDHPGRLYLNMSEKARTLFANLDMTVNGEESQLSWGVQVEQDRRREFKMTQRNWNFLPPFANTDNPFIYQQALNEIYDSISGNIDGWNGAGYISLSHQIAWLTFENGLRVDHYSRLTEPTSLVYRHRVTARTGENSRLSLFHGIFTQSPLDNILESYQILVRAGINELKPVRTNLWALSVSCGAFNAEVFRKHITSLPLTTPDFELAAEADGPTDGFITMRSTGKARFYGGSVSFEKDGFLSRRLSISASYAYTHAYKVDHGVALAYDLDSPHRLQAQVDYRASSRLTLGAELQVRSGYPYSPIRTNYSADESNLYTEEYYYSVLQQENSQRFPTNAYLNLSANYAVGNLNLFMSISNVTNRANPIINSASGLIYDAGILPMIGLRLRF